MKYDIITPMIPGNHIDGWEKIRKSQWKFVRRVLSEQLDIRGDKLKDRKDFYLNYFEYYEDEDSEVFDFSPDPVLEFWFCPDQSQQKWRKIWDLFRTEYASCVNYKDAQMDFFRIADAGLKDDNHKALEYVLLVA